LFVTNPEAIALRMRTVSLEFVKKADFTEIGTIGTFANGIRAA